MPRHQSRELRARWDEETTPFAIDALLRGRPISPHGLHEGRIDLRGLTIEKSERVGTNDKLSSVAKLYEFESRKIEDVDLSCAVLNDWRVIESTFTNCIFDNAKLPGFRAYSAQFDSCSFRSSILRDATMGAKESGNDTGSVYQDCDFSGADLRDISTEHGRFHSCLFIGSHWLGTQNLSAVFEDCDFREAEISEVYFDGRRFDNNGLAGLGDNRMSGCNFSTAIMEYTGFLAIDFRDLIPPTADRYVLIDDFPSKVQIAVDRLTANGSREAMGLELIFDMTFKAASVMPKDAVGLLDIGDLSEEDARLLMAVFEVNR